MLDDRKTAILRAVVEGYINSTQPVGSGTVAASAGIDVSSATIRNEMAVLENEGYLRSPHTSAGRVPTDKGYRYFVDNMRRGGALEPTEVAHVADFFNRTHGELERLLQDTSALLSGMTDSAAVVVDDSVGASEIRSVQLVGLAERVVLCVVVLSSGVVEKSTLEFDGEVDANLLPVAAGLMTDAVAGTSLHRVGPCPSAPPGNDALAPLLQAAHGALQELAAAADARLFIDGTARVAAAFDAVETVRSVLTILERQLVVVTLVRDVLAQGRRVAIGSETGNERLAECSLVVAPFDVAGERAGTIGVLGPTRMDYSQALDAVSLVSEQLGHHLTEG